MTTIGFDKPLYILPFDHRGTFQTKMFGWKGTLTAEQTAEIVALKRVIYDGFRTALGAGVPRQKAGILLARRAVHPGGGRRRDRPPLPGVVRQLREGRR